MKRWLAVFVVLVLVAIPVASFVRSGYYNVAATEQHTAPVYWLLEAGMNKSVKARAAGIVVPPLDDAATTTRGLLLYEQHCVQCHGAPGVAPAPFALGMMPVPANLALTAREWPATELYWVVRYGIKMSGMPAWEFRLADAELWAIVAFLQTLPALAPADYRAMVRDAGASKLTVATQPHVAGHDGDNAERGKHVAVRGGGNAKRGKTALQQYACVSCHEIPHIVGADKAVGPPLAGIASRPFIAGVVPNTRANMVRWLQSPQAIAARTAMPDLGVSTRDAHDIAAFLATLR